MSEMFDKSQMSETIDVPAGCTLMGLLSVLKYWSEIDFLWSFETDTILSTTPKNTEKR